MQLTRHTISLPRSLALVAALPAAALISAGPAVADSNSHATSDGGAKPTVVLVHGAFADASGWDSTIQSLQAKGYPVVATANPLRSLTGDSAYLAAVLKTIKGPIILVGHSYGGAVITNAAAGNPNVKSLVYIAAFAPDKGETTAQLTAKFPGSQLTDDPQAPVPTALNPIPLGESPTNVDLVIKPDKFSNVFLSNRLSAAKSASLAASQRPANVATNAQPTESVAWKTIPSWYLVATDDRTIGTENLRYMAKRAGSTTVDVDAPHDVPETNPDAVTNLILDAAHGTRPSLAHTGANEKAAALGGISALAIGTGTLMVMRARRHGTRN
ncbi:alpha/beta hydrolase [Streptomyces sp. NPDC095817]|uniref:alpha/beta fold hydrolase n=1 Tax=Streptomyces sp. NPDC095817 TaxID=3155082 RepID=UPI00331778C3